ncbi:pirin family protein [Pseudomaricurvus sp.]|uniref:pirin family protein n=1 Tax=Pseudomaricurvus sp. TaxID=2004510 RepID=UPI003F6C64DD
MNSELNRSRELIGVYSTQQTVDGDGVEIQRIVTQQAYEQFDPFLMLDEFKGGFDGQQTRGFPEHPHRGFETVTYMLDGAIEHRDHLGNVGRLVSGGVQWMTAGRGVLHSELPIAEQNYFHGFQIWVNLPASEKMTEPKYREFGPEEIPTLNLANGNCIKVIAGTATHEEHSATGPVKDVATQPDYWDVNMLGATEMSLPISSSKRVLMYVYEGSIDIKLKGAASTIDSQQMVVLSPGESLEVTANEVSRFLVLTAEPINEPVVSWGPFVMNTREEIKQAINDYNHGVLV